VTGGAEACATPKRRGGAAAARSLVAPSRPRSLAVRPLRVAGPVLLLVTAILASCSSRLGLRGEPERASDDRFPFGLEGDAGRDGLIPAERQEPATAQESKPEEEPPEERSFLHVLLLYIPNRIVDLLDIARFGIDVGPGIGLDLTATEYARLALLTRISAGVGYQTLRHMPVKAGAESNFGVGPFGANVGFPLTWYRNTWDLRVEAHLLIVGAHVAVNPAEILDAVLGLTTFDLLGDDF
jgi:hypothetical protein